MAMESKKLNILSIDGGGVRGMSSLYILKQMMESIDPENPPKPCAYFDLIGGTSTGGLIAIMLGRLQMDVDSCIDAYSKLADGVFQKVKHRVTISGRVQGRFDSKALEDAVKAIVRASGLDENALLKDAPGAKCKVIVFATRAENRSIAPLCTYHSPRYMMDMLNSVKIWEAARATSAASSFFDSISIGKHGEEFVDGATGCNNPIKEIWNAANDIWTDGSLLDRISCIISIGTGQPSLRAFGDHVIDVAKTLTEIATDTEYTAELFSREHRELYAGHKYFRFNVEKGLEDIGLEDCTKHGAIVSATRRYMESQSIFEQMQACCRLLPIKEHRFILQSKAPVAQNIKFIRAVEGDQLDLVQTLLLEGQPVNFESSDGKTPLGIAARNGNVEMVKVLLKHHGDMEKKDQNLAPLCWAADEGHLEVVQTLLENGADIESKESDGTPLLYASHKGHKAVVEMLLLGGAETEAIISPEDSTPLMLAATLESIETTEVLLKNGAHLMARDADGYTALHYAACFGNDKTVSFLLAKGMPVNVTSTDFTTSLHTAAFQGYDSVVSLLLEHGADLHAKGVLKRTPLHSAAAGNRPTTIEILLQIGALLSTQDEEGLSPMHMAAMTGSLAAAELLLAKGAMIDSKALYDLTPLISAARKGNSTMVKWLCDHGASLNARDSSNGDSALHAAVWEGHLDVVNVLLDYGMQIDSRNKDQNTPLHLAVSKNNAAIVDALLRKGCSIEAKNKKFETPMHFAVGWGNTEMIDLLCRWHADVNTPSVKQDVPSPLHAAIRSIDSPNKVMVINKLLDMGARLEVATSDGRTALHIAARAGLEDVVSLLLRRGANVSAKDMYLATPLHHAAWSSSPNATAVMHILLDHGASLEARDCNSMTPLHGAAWEGLTRTAELLIDQGASTESRDSSLDTPLTLAAYNGHDGMVSLLLRKGAAIGVAANDDKTALHHAARKNHAQVVQVLLQHGANIEADDSEGRSPLYHVCKLGHLQLARLLLEMGANSMHPSYAGSTPLHTAAFHNRTDIVQLLLQSGVPVDIASIQGSTALHGAASRGHLATTRLLLQYSARTDVVNSKWQRPIDMATNADVLALLMADPKERKLDSQNSSDTSEPPFSRGGRRHS